MGENDPLLVGAPGDSPADIFRQVLLQALPELRGAVSERAWEAVWRIAHRLRGSAGLLERHDISRPAAAFQSAWGRAKHPQSVKAGAEVVESAEALVRACERAQASEPI